MVSMKTLLLTMLAFFWVMCGLSVRSLEAVCTDTGLPGGDFWAVETPVGGDNRFDENAAQELKDKRMVRAASLFELQDNILEIFRSSGCVCIQNLLIVGHGQSGSISVGNGQYGYDPARRIDLADPTETWSGPLMTLRSLMCNTGPILWLIGCNVGECNSGDSFLTRVARELQVVVTAPVDRPFYLGWPLQTSLGSGLLNYIRNGRWQTAGPLPGQINPHMVAANDQFLRNGQRELLAAKGFECPCDGSFFPDVGVCTNSCTVSLGCFTNICTSAVVNNTPERFSGNPVLTGGTGSVASFAAPAAIPGWEDGGVTHPAILKDGATYKMWYMGWDWSDTWWRIGYATSPDGFTWTKYAGNPVLTEGAPGSWDSGSVYRPSVIKDGTVYKMWYQGYSDMSRIGYATSPDGVTWVKNPTPVLDLGAGSAWDYHGVGAPSVMKDGSVYKMWYAGYDGWYWRIGYATSPDGINWTKHSGNPVLTEGSAGSWDVGGAYSPRVVKEGTNYHMLYGSNDENAEEHIGYAGSTDGIHWTKSSGYPLLNRGLGVAWDNGDVAHPSFLRDSNEGIYKVYYRGKDQSSNYGIGYSTLTCLPMFLFGNASSKTLVGTSNQSTLTLAYGATSSVNGYTIKAGGTDFVENLTLNNATKNVTLKGGYDSGFNSNSCLYTSLQGTLTIAQGSLNVERLSIK